MNIASTNLIVRDTKEDAMARVNAADNASNNGANNNPSSNASIAQTKVVKADTVDLSQKSVELSEEHVDREKARNALKQGQRELLHLVRGLKKLGMGSRKIGKIIRSANREANKSIGIVIKQAYNDYRSHKIDEQSFHTKLYGAAAKKLDGIISALRNTFDQKVASAEKNAEKVKEAANETKSNKATKATGETRVTDADDAAMANAEKSTEADEFKIVNDDGSADNTFDQIIEIFIDIDKLVNGFADRAEGEEEVKDSNDKDDSLISFASKLNDMFSGINKAFGKHEDDNVGNRLGKAQGGNETVRQLFGSEHGSGNFNAVSFMSSLSNNFNDALESYKDVPESEKEAKEQEESKEVVGALA